MNIESRPIEADVSKGEKVTGERRTFNAWALFAKTLFILVTAIGISAVVKEVGLVDKSDWIADWLVPICCFIMLLIVLISRKMIKCWER